MLLQSAMYSTVLKRCIKEIKNVVSWMYLLGKTNRNNIRGTFWQQKLQKTQEYIE